MENLRGDYVIIGEHYTTNETSVSSAMHGDQMALHPQNPSHPPQRLWWAKVFAICIVVAAAGFLFFTYVAPKFMEKEVIPLLDWLTKTFNPPQLALLIFASLVLFPVLLLPSTPCVWIAGIIFGYGIGFLIVMAGVSVGMTLPYFIGFPFRTRIRRWLEKYPKQATVLRLAGEGNWFHQFKAVFLIRVSPFPYSLFNYAIVTTGVRYWPYLFGSQAGMVGDVLLTLYSGILISKLAGAAHGQKGLSRPQVAVDVIGFSISAAAAAFIGLYATRKLAQRQREESLRMDTLSVGTGMNLPEGTS